MTKIRVITAAVLMLMASHGSSGQDLAGDWQGTLTAPRPLRLIVHLERADDTTWKATLASIDQSPDWGATVPVDSVFVQGKNVRFAVAPLRAAFDGTISPDTNSVVGTWTEGANQSPLTLARATPASAWKDPAAHSVRFVPVEPDVSLEVLDWGGPPTGPTRTLVLVPGLGNTAHVFDALAPKLATRYRVLGITRRGFGASSAPASGYGADRLGDDVLAVMQQLSVNKPVVVGHSFGGEELSSIGSRHPERVAGLVYLEAGYSYAFYAPGIEPIPAPPSPEAPLPPVIRAIMDGTKKYTALPVPILAVYAIPQDPAPTADAARRAANDAENRKGEAQLQAFAAALPTARVVRIPHGNHYVFISNEADVTRELDAFIAQLK
jgi:pimeloyl-ACP methyl ester carboxylesterase